MARPAILSPAPPRRGTSRHSGEGRGPTGTAARGLRWAIVAAALCAPWFYGGGGVPARMGFAALGLALVCCDLQLHSWRRDARRLPLVLVPGALLLAYAVVQLIPGFGSGARDLFPHAAISSDPFSTGLAIFEMLGMTAWIYLGGNYFASRRRLGLLAAVLLGGVLFQSGYAIFQFARHSPYVFHRYNPSEGGAGFGTFIDRDHLAEYLLGAGTFAIACLWTRARRVEYRFLLALAAIVIALGLASSLSRGGLLLGAGLLAVAALVPRSQLRKPAWLVIAATTGLLAFFGAGRLFQRLLQSNWQFETTHGRLAAWRNCLAVAHHFLPWGSGFGTFEFAYAPFAFFTGPVGRLNAAHNDGLQLLIEGGWVAILTMAAAVVVLIRAYRSREKSAESGPVWLALVLVAINSLFDFGLHVAGIGILIALLVGIASAGTGAVRRVRLPRWAASLVGLALLLPALAAGRHGLIAWQADHALTPAALQLAAQREPRNSARWKAWALALPSLPEQLPRLRRATELNPWDGEAWARLGGAESLVAPALAAADLQRAMRADPSSYVVRRTAASAYFLLGDTQRSLQQWGLAVRANPAFLPEIVTAALQIAPARQFQPLLPLDAGILSAFIRQVRRDHVLAAADAFRRLLTLQPQPPPDLTRALLDDLVDQGHWPEARRLWTEIAPRYQAAPAGQGDFTNADFQTRPFDGGLDWRTRALPPGMTVDYRPVCENRPFPCVRIRMDSVADVGFLSPFQVVPVAPGQLYRFAAEVRVEDLTTDQGVGLEVREYRSDRVLASSPRLLGTQDWQLLTTTLRIPAGVSQIVVGVGRQISNRMAHVPLSGTAWLRTAHFHLEMGEAPSGAAIRAGAGSGNQ